MPSPTRLELRSVWGTGPTDVYAVGEDGIMLRFNGSSWSVMAKPQSELLLTVAGSSGGMVRAVGARGVVLEGVR